MITLDYRTNSDKDVVEALEKYAKGEQLCLKFINYSPAYFVSKFDMEPDDSNGWDWWGHIAYNGVRIPVFGDAWYGNISMEHPDYDRYTDPDITKVHHEMYDRFDEPLSNNVTEYHNVEEDTYFVPRNYVKFYFWKFANNNYTLVYAKTEQEARNFIINLWKSYDDIATVSEFMEKKKWYDEHNHYAKDSVIFNGDVYIIG